MWRRGHSKRHTEPSQRLGTPFVCGRYLIASSLQMKASVEWPGKYRPIVINQNGFSSVRL